MSILDWFEKKEKAAITREKLNIPDDLWVKCFDCGGMLYLKDLEQNKKVCSHCNYHFRLTPLERITQLLDADSFVECNAEIAPVDFLSFSDTSPYKERIKKAQAKTIRKDAVITGTGKLLGQTISLAVMDFGFMGGSMGSVVGEKITRLIEEAIAKTQPVIIVCTSGGARIQEGLSSLMQMAKTSGALKKLSEAKLPFISILTDPTTGGTTASFAMLGDINIAEPGALISFAGPRVIEQTIREKLPEGFQRSEFLLQHGIVDLVVHRSQLREKIGQLLPALTAFRSKKTPKKDEL